MSGSDGDYEVGYGRPPVSGQFKKGRSGNPKGRTKGSKNLQTLVSQALNETVMVTSEGRRKKMSKVEAAFIQQANKAAAGDPKALKLILDILAAEEGRGGPIETPAAERARQKEETALVVQALKDRLMGGDHHVDG